MENNKYTNDHFAKKAQIMGYKARSVFKLQEIQEKYNIIRKKNIVLDLGAAPGSFMQYMSKIVGKKGLLIGIDLQKIDIQEKNCVAIKKDITEINKDFIEQVLPKGKQFIDVVTADLAPKTGASKELNHYRSMELNQEVLRVANEVLKPQGYVITKMFEGEDSNEVIAEFNKTFKEIKRFKPQASKRSRNEFFYVGQKKEK